LVRRIEDMRAFALFAQPVAAIIAAIACTAVVQGFPLQDPTRVARLVVFSDDDFWLNLHHFLYVLGRAQAGFPDARREEVVGAPREQNERLATLDPDEQARWREAVDFYAQGPSRRDVVFDDRLVATTRALAALGDAATLDAASPDIGSDLAHTLERAATAYRKAWWPAHHRGNQEWVKDTAALVDRHGPQVAGLLTRAYQLPWPSRGYPVHVCAYANWAGAYSTTGPLLVIASLDAGQRGSAALETVFHEASHQWDDQVLATLDAIGRTIGKHVPDGLTHAMIWMAAGEAVRSAVPDHVPIAEAGGLWQRGPNPALRPSLDAVWLPYLRGKGSRDETLTALMKLAGR
jgi:hypothetical protein